MTFLLLLFTGGCAFWDLKKRRIPNGMLLLGGLLFLLIRFGLGMKMGYTAGWDGRLPGYGAALMMGIGETCGYLIRVGSLLIVLFPLYRFRMRGAGDLKMAAVLFGAAGLRQLPEYGRLYYLSGVGLPGSGLHILCFICTGPRLGEASSRTIWKRGMEKRHLFVWHRACFWE